VLEVQISGHSVYINLYFNGCLEVVLLRAERRVCDLPVVGLLGLSIPQLILRVPMDSRRVISRTVKTAVLDTFLFT